MGSSRGRRRPRTARRACPFGSMDQQGTAHSARFGGLPAIATPPSFLLYSLGLDSSVYYAARLPLDATAQCRCSLRARTAYSRFLSVRGDSWRACRWFARVSVCFRMCQRESISRTLRSTRSSRLLLVLVRHARRPLSESSGEARACGHGCVRASLAFHAGGQTACSRQFYTTRFACRLFV